MRKLEEQVDLLLLLLFFSPWDAL